MPSFPTDAPRKAPALRTWLSKELASAQEQGSASVLAEALLEDVLGWRKPYTSLPDASEDQMERLFQSLEKVKAGEPLAYATGIAHFLGMRLQVDKRVLIPRPETEELVMAVYEAWKGRTPKILDVGTGSACVALALAERLPGAEVMGVDISQDAIAVAQANATEMGKTVTWHVGDFLDPSFWNEIGQVDVLVSNPPYIDPQEAPDLAHHVAEHEPHMALFAPPNDALAFYRASIAFVQSRIAKADAPRAFLETSSLTGKAALDLVFAAGMEGRLLQDMSGRDRILVLD